MLNDDNAVTALAEAVARVGSYRWPVQLLWPLSARVTRDRFRSPSMSRFMRPRAAMIRSSAFLPPSLAERERLEVTNRDRR